MNKTVKTDHQTRLQDALFAARELHHDPEVTYSAYWFNEYQSRMGDLLAALDAARLEAVAWMTAGGDVSRSKLWCDERSLGGEPSPLYLAPPAAVCEVCTGTGGVRSYMNGRDTTHPCPRGCTPPAPMARGQAVAWYSIEVATHGSFNEAFFPFKPHEDGDWQPLYLAPPAPMAVAEDEKLAQAALQLFMAAVNVDLMEKFRDLFPRKHAKLREAINRIRPLLDEVDAHAQENKDEDTVR